MAVRVVYDVACVRIFPEATFEVFEVVCYHILCLLVVCLESGESISGSFFFFS